MRARYPIVFALTVLIVAGCHSPAPQQAVSIEQVPVTGESNVIISVSERPTMFRVRSKASGKHIVPGIDIFADGRCIVRRFDGTEMEKQISRTELSDLLGFLDRVGFFRLTDSQIQAQVKAVQYLPGGRWRAVSDANYIVVFARTISKKNQVERYALEHEIEWYPEIVDLRVMRDAFCKVYEVVQESRTWCK